MGRTRSVSRTRGPPDREASPYQHLILFTEMVRDLSRRIRIRSSGPEVILVGDELRRARTLAGGSEGCRQRTWTQARLGEVGDRTRRQRRAQRWSRWHLRWTNRRRRRATAAADTGEIGATRAKLERGSGRGCSVEGGEATGVEFGGGSVLLL
jgi:hypothetical protein